MITESTIVISKELLNSFREEALYILRHNYTSLISTERTVTPTYYAGGTLCIDYHDNCYMYHLDGTFSRAFEKDNFQLSYKDQLIVRSIYRRTKGLSDYYNKERLNWIIDKRDMFVENDVNENNPGELVQGSIVKYSGTFGTWAERCYADWFIDRDTAYVVKSIVNRRGNQIEVTLDGIETTFDSRLFTQVVRNKM